MTSPGVGEARVRALRRGRRRVRDGIVAVLMEVGRSGGGWMDGFGEGEERNRARGNGGGLLVSMVEKVECD